MSNGFAALVGIALGALTIVAARTARGERWVYSIALLSLPSLYAFFALRAGNEAVASKELLYGLPYLTAGLFFAFINVRLSAIVVGLLWILHGLYDLIHGKLIDNPGVPAWYPAFCFAVDVVIGAYLLWLSRRLPSADLRNA